MEEGRRKSFRHDAITRGPSLPYFSPETPNSDQPYDKMNPRQNHDFYNFVCKNYEEAEKLLEDADARFFGRDNVGLWKGIKSILLRMYKQDIQTFSLAAMQLKELQERFKHYTDKGFGVYLKKLPFFPLEIPPTAFSLYCKDLKEKEVWPVSRQVAWNQWMEAPLKEIRHWRDRLAEIGISLQYFYPESYLRHEFLYDPKCSIMNHKFYEFCQKRYVSVEAMIDDQHRAFVDKNGIRQRIVESKKRMWCVIKTELCAEFCNWRRRRDSAHSKSKFRTRKNTL